MHLTELDSTAIAELPDFDASSFDCPGCFSDYGFCVRHDVSHLTEQARHYVGRLLADQPERLAHTLAVGSVAAQMVQTSVSRGEKSGKVADIAGCAGTLHDIGYADELVSTSMHAYDGATWLEAKGVPKQIVSLVAYHSTSKYECALANLDLSRFENPDSTFLGDVIWAADFTVDPRGHRISPASRIDDITSRYEPESSVVQALTLSMPDFHEVLKRLGIDYYQTGSYERIAL